MTGLKHWFFVQPIIQVCIETVLMFVLWTVLMLILRGKARRVAACVGFLLAVALIIAMTVWGRRSGSRCELSLIPLITFVRAKSTPVLYRSLLMNVILFMPFGLSLPFALPEKVKLKPLIAIIGGFVLSAAVEATQYFRKFGECETDDVIMNTLGAAAGVMSFVIVCAVLKRIKHKKQ